jgi:hypothetical protein
MPFLLRLFFFCLLTLPGFGGDVSFLAIDKVRGLPSNTVYDLIQDRRGFIWLATDKGLFRYDGVNFRSYANRQQNGKSLSNPMLDARGRVWFQNFTGQFFYVEGDSLHLCGKLPPTGAYYPAAIVGGHTLMSVGRQGIRRFDVGTFRLAETRMNIGKLRPFAQVNGGYYYLHDARTNRLVGTNSAGQQVSVMATADSSTFFHAVVNKTLFLIPKTDVSQLTGRYLNGRPYTLKLGRKSLIQNATVLDDRYLVLFTTAGFYLIDVRRGQTYATPQLTDKNCTAMIHDREGNYWLTTANAGLLLIPSLSVEVLGAGTSFSRLHTTAAGTLYYGTTNGEVGQVDVGRRTFTVLHKPVVANAQVLSLYHDPIGQQTLFCTDKPYLLRRGYVTTLEAMSVKDIEPMGGRQVAMAATGTLARYDLDGPVPRIERIGNDNERVRAVAYAPATGSLYAATSTGLWLNQSGLPPRSIIHEGKPLTLTDITYDTDVPNPRLYAAGATEGLYGIDHDRVVLHLTKADGLTDNSLYRVRTYKGEVWWLTETAVQAYNPTTRQVRTYTKTDGLPDADLYDLAFLNDTVYVTTPVGIVRFPAQMPATNQNRPVVAITGLFRNREAVPLRKPARFGHDQNTIDIRYSVLSYRSQGAVQVYYRINEQAWLRADDAQRLISLPSLAPDDYVVQIRAVNEDGLASAKLVSVRFSIGRPFWQQWWFLALVGLSLAGLVYWLYRSRLNRQAREARLQAERNALAQELQQSRLTAIKSQMNPHFLFNALNTIQSYIYLNEKKQASTYLVKFSELTRLILDMSSGDTVALAEELKAIGLYLELEQMRFEDTLTYRLTVDDGLDPEQVRIPSMLIQPYIENAIKHGLMHKKTDRHLLVSFKKQPGFVEVEIDDDGVGRARAGEIAQHRATSAMRRHESFASAANQKRLELLNDGQHARIGLEIIDKTDAAGQASGTKVILRIPI